MFRSSSILLALVAAASFGVAQSNWKPAGDYAGMLGPYHIKLHLHAAPDGSLTATVDSPDANMFGLQCTNFSLNGPAFSFNVPMVQGTWSGVVSADGSTLSGVWMQGTQGPQAQPHPLNLARGAGASDAAGPTPAMPQQTVLATAPQKGVASCPLGSLANYWDGSSWKPLRTPEMLTGERGFSMHEAMKNPFNDMRGNTIIMKYTGIESATVVAPSVRFCFTVGTNATAQYLMGTLDVKSGHREIEYTRSDSGSQGWLPLKRQRPVNAQRASDRMIVVTPVEPLPPGQYIIGTSFNMVYDFTVR
ncbi:MAG TPA: hypothetical protein VE178_05440 [Silvibacterium sp.]|nr:hypothetical protein [Silvibacterium sp.]